MKRFVLVLALLCATPVWGAIAFVPASHTLCSQTSASAGTACNLIAPTTAGDLVVAGLTWSTRTSIDDVVGSAASSYFFPYAQVCNGSGSCSAILICHDCAALTAVTPHFTGSTNYNLSVEEYSGVAAIGITRTATGTSATPGITVTTGDPNDWLVAVTSSVGTSGVPAAGTGNLRNSGSTGSTSGSVAGAACDNTVASAGSLSCTTAIASGAWSAAAVELRTTYAATYIWPDCNSTHPCVIHEKDTVSMGTGTDTLTGPFQITVPPTLPGNLMKLTISHPSAATVTSVTDDHSNTWTVGATTTDTSNNEITEVRYVCGAATGTSAISVAFSSAIVDGDVAQFSYAEVSGIAASSCGDGSSGSSEGQGILNPGPITTTSSGDMIFTFGIGTARWVENGTQAGVAMPDDSSAKIAENDFDQFMSMVEVQTAVGAINPTIYANAQDVNNTAYLYWNIVSQAFRASTGAGTQPSGIQVVTDQHFINWTGLGWSPLPSNGNVVVFSTSNPSAGWGLINLTDNYGATYTRTPYSDASVDPQQVAACLGSNVSARDRIFSYTADTHQTHVEIYTLAGAKNATGTGCVGTTVNHYAGTQGSITNDNIVGDPVVKPTINAGYTSAVITTGYTGTGPPTAMCISGGVTPPTCTGQSAGVIFNDIYAKGMTDQSSYSTGDPFSFFYTNSTASRSMDYLMANNTSGTVYFGAAIEIFGGGSNAESPGTGGYSVWIVDGTGGSSELNSNGGGMTSGADPGGNIALAVDSDGNVWTIGSGTPPLEETTSAGQVEDQIAAGTGGLDLPAAIAIDGNNRVWVANGNNSVSLFSNADKALSPSSGFTASSLSTPSAIAIDVAGSVWIANKGNSSLTRILGAAAPVSPVAAAVANNTTGTRP